MLFVIMVIGLTIFLSALLVFVLLELVYARIFKRPLLVYTHLVVLELQASQHQFLSSRFSFYRKLSSRKQKLFGHRVLKYIQDKQFIARGEVVITENLKLWIAATAVMLTFGMRRYLMPSVKRFIIYPEQYESILNRAEHIGEYNPALKTIVFSWKDFLKGYEIEDDNLNLAIHEFAHALSYESLKIKDSSTVIFSDGLHRIDRLLQDPHFMHRLHKTDYFRDYAKVNKFEFFAVSLEHFIETPEVFRKEFPGLYAILHQMLNYQFGEES
ncbi:zinc-dependent peptidase [Flavobacteriaceae bacterium M23B6Z8]